MIPYYIGMSGFTSLVIVFITNLFLVVQCLRLYKTMEVKAARRVMFSSYIHLPIVLLALLVNKIPVDSEQLGVIWKMVHRVLC